MASDFALTFARAAVVASYQVVVLFVVATSEDVQLGAVYLIGNSYPCPILLSRKLSFWCCTDMLEIVSWIMDLGHHCQRIMAF